MFPSTGNMLLMMSFAAGTFFSGTSSNPQHLMLAAPSNGIPNNLLPLIIYPRVAPEDLFDEENPGDIAAFFEERFAMNGWTPRWRDQVFPYTHYHPNTHELLGICDGWAEILFGGESGRMVTLRAGDVVLIPAGVGHQQVAASEEFLAVGAYPGEMEPVILRDDRSIMAQSIEQIKRVPLPKTDPITGGEGAVIDYWHSIAKQAGYAP